MERLFESVQDKVGISCSAGPPADDPPRVGVDDEGDIDEASPGRDIGKNRPATDGQARKRGTVGSHGPADRGSPCR